MASPQHQHSRALQPPQVTLLQYCGSGSMVWDRVDNDAAVVGLH